MNEARGPSVRIAWPIIVGIAVIGIVVIARASSDSNEFGQLVRDAESRVLALPETISQLRDALRARLSEAKAAFRAARAESESVLVSQLNEAKQRGSLPPGND
jgi:hypothetical protein